MKQITSFVFLFVITLFCFGQKIKQGSTITVFKPEDTKAIIAADSGKNQDRHNIKWNYSLVTRGVFLINYETPLTNKITAEVGVGLAYRDYLFEMTKLLSVFDDDGTFFEGYGAANTNVCGEVGIRFYPGKFDNFEGVYLSPMISYRKYSFSTEGQSSYYPKGDFTPGYNFLDIQFKFGYQYESLWSYDFLSDFYMGFGMRNATVNYYEYVSSSTGQDYIPVMKELKWYPQVLFGIKFCVPF